MNKFYRKLVKKPGQDDAQPEAQAQTQAPLPANETTPVPASTAKSNDKRISAVEISRQKSEKFTNAIPRDQHNISRKLLSPNALKVLYRLQDNGYEAYLVGGCIRDILLGQKPKDFDVATNATPEQIKACFNNCRLIGRRFRLAHIMYGREVIEVATFRGHHDQPPPQNNNKSNTSHHSNEGQLLRDNVYGSIEEDAQRRDFTINALYYTIDGFYIRDFAHGIDAIKAKKIELIGDPEARYREDPVRMLRAVRFSTKLDMTIEAKTEAPMFELADLLTNIPSARLFEESLKLMLAGKAELNYLAMRKYGLFEAMHPIPSEVLDGNQQSKQERLVHQMFINTDSRINNNKRVTPAYIYAALLWYVLEREIDLNMKDKGLNYYDASYQAMNDVLARHAKSLALPRRFSTVSRDIWQLQLRLPRRNGRRANKLMEHPKFRAGYDFLLLRGEIEGGDLAELGQWWTDFIEGDEKIRNTMVKQLNNQQGAVSQDDASHEDAEEAQDFDAQRAADADVKRPRSRNRHRNRSRRGGADKPAASANKPAGSPPPSDNSQ
ncbi:MAG: poly(A) polymerase [Phenylobacterium sp.]